MKKSANFLRGIHQHITVGKFESLVVKKIDGNFLIEGVNLVKTRYQITTPI